MSIDDLTIINKLLKKCYWYIQYSADAQYTSSVINTNVIVSDNGEVNLHIFLLCFLSEYYRALVAYNVPQVVWLSHGIFRSSCDINVEYFPFDLQSCKMKWASWTYDGFQVCVHLSFWLYLKIKIEKCSHLTRNAKRNPPNFKNKKRDSMGEYRHRLIRKEGRYIQERTVYLSVYTFFKNLVILSEIITLHVNL